MPAAAERTLNKKLSQIFRMRGLSLRPDAMKPLYDVLQGDEAWETTLHGLLAEVQHQELKGGHVDASAVRGAIGALRQRSSAKPTLPLEAIDAFAMPPVRYDKQRKALIAENAAASLHAEASSKSAMLVLRLAMVEQRVRRHHMFKPPVLANGIAPKERLELTGIDALLGRTGVRVVLGLLAELEEGVFALEDSHSSIPLDLSSADVTPGLFTRHSIVLAEGEVMPTGVFRVRQLGLPPPETREASLESLGSFDLLRAAAAADGSPTPKTSLGKSAHAASARGAATARTSAIAKQNAMLVVLSDIWLDSSTVLAQLQTLFEGYESVGAASIGTGKSAVPLASFFTFVLIGNFSSGGLAVGASAPSGSAFSSNFKQLALLLAKSPTLAKHAHFVLVPGPDDPSVGAADVMPRARLPSFMCAELLNTCSHLELMSGAPPPTQSQPPSLTPPHPSPPTPPPSHSHTHPSTCLCQMRRSPVPPRPVRPNNSHPPRGAPRQGTPRMRHPAAHRPRRGRHATPRAPHQVCPRRGPPLPTTTGGDCGLLAARSCPMAASRPRRAHPR